MEATAATTATTVAPTSTTAAVVASRAPRRAALAFPHTRLHVAYEAADTATVTATDTNKRARAAAISTTTTAAVLVRGDSLECAPGAGLPNLDVKDPFERVGRSDQASARPRRELGLDAQLVQLGIDEDRPRRARVAGSRLAADPAQRAAAREPAHPNRQRGQPERAALRAQNWK